MKKFNISLIGTGALGTALSYLILLNKHHLTVFEPNKTNLHRYLTHRQIKSFTNITTNKSINDCLTSQYDFIIPCIPSKYIASFYNSFFQTKNKHSHLISISKGLYPQTTNTISQQIKDYFPLSKFSVLSGPTFANEILQNKPTYCTIATTTKSEYKNVQSIFENIFFQTNHDRDLVAVELGGILKNCYSVSLGIIDHYFQMNTKSLAIIQIMTEVKNLYQKLKIETDHVTKLHFLGDLIATGLNRDSRNTLFGHDLKYKKNTTIEGADNISPILKLAKSKQISLPILKQTQKIIKNPSPANIDQLSTILLSKN